MKKILTLILLIATCSFSQKYNAVITSFISQGNIEPGRTAAISVTVKNYSVDLLGKGISWTPGSFFLRPTRPNGTSRWGVTSVPINRTVAYNGTFTFNITVTAPSTNGNYDLGWRMCQGSGNYFGQEAYRPVTVQYLPSQFMTILYSEVLGRTPDPVGYEYWMGYFRDNGCNLATLETATNACFNSSEYAALGYDNEEKVTTLYRGVVCRDPDFNGFTAWVNALNAGTSLSSVVHQMMFSNDFDILTNAFSGNPYGWRPVAPAALMRPTVVRNQTNTATSFYYNPTSDGDFSMFVANRSSGQTVFLYENEIVVLNTLLTIPNGVRITTATTGLKASQYAKFARILRGPSLAGTAGYLITMTSNSTLDHVWIDGQMAVNGRSPDAANIKIADGNSNVTIADCKVTDSPGWSTIYAAPLGTKIIIRNNIITCYSSRHYMINDVFQWCDGISCFGAEADITGNTVLDATDVSIILVANAAGVPAQKSRVTENWIFNSGNSAPAAFDLCQNGDKDQNGVNIFVSPQSFDGVIFSNNHIGTGTNAHFDIALSIGNRGWNGAETAIGNGAITISNNSNISNSIRCNMGLYVNNMGDVNNNVSVLGNNMVFNLVNACNLPLLSFSFYNSLISSGSQALTAITDNQQLNFIDGKAGADALFNR